ncbi:MAG: helix-turn-helix transcriptional regulator [Actinobacteria bacterium]|nr:helix-turn-helix transcriptional regulator [Actinomycetota bacterium]
MLRDGGQDLREYLITTAARLIAERGTAGLAVRDIARAAQVADGVLYNYFDDKEDLLAHALLAHVASVMGGSAPVPEPGTGTVAGNLESFIANGLAVLTRVMPAFAGLVTQPNVLTRFRAMIGGNEAFGAARQAGDGAREPPEGGGPQGQGLPQLLTGYLRGEQRLGRIDPGADVDAAATLVVGAIHGEILPPMLFNPGGGPPVIPPGLARRLAATVLSGIAPGSSAK